MPQASMLRVQTRYTVKITRITRLLLQHLPHGALLLVLQWRGIRKKSPRGCRLSVNWRLLPCRRGRLLRRC